MIFDKENLLSDEQAVTDTANSENVIDLGVARDIGKGVPVPIIVQVVEDFATLTSLTVSIITSANENLSSPTTLATGPTVAAADLLAGKELTVDYVPRETDRYLGLTYTVAGSTATAGKVTAGIIAGHQHGY